MDFDRPSASAHASQPKLPPWLTPLPDYQPPILIILVIAIVFSLIRLIYRAIQRRGARKRDREWEDRLRAEWEARLRAVGGVVSEQLVRGHPAPSITALPHNGSPELAGWKGLRWGVPLGVGLGVVMFYGYVWESAPEVVLLVLVVWWVVWVRRQDEIEGEVEAEMKGLEYQAAFFGIVLGVGGGVIFGAGLHLGWKLQWMAALCGGWTLVWVSQGMGLTWVEEGRKLRLSGFAMGGSRLNVVLVLVAGIRNVLLGVSWMLMLLLGVIVWLYGKLAKLSRGTMVQGQEIPVIALAETTENGPQTSDVVQTEDVGASAEDRPEMESRTGLQEKGQLRMSSCKSLNRDVGTWKK